MRRIKWSLNKIRIGNSEISVFSPIKNEPELNAFEDYANKSQNAIHDEKSVRLDSTRNKKSIINNLNIDLNHVSNKEINELYAEIKEDLNRTNSLKNSPSKNTLRRELSQDTKFGQSGDKNKYIGAPFSFVKQPESSPKRSASKSISKKNNIKSKGYFDYEIFMLWILIL